VPISGRDLPGRDWPAIDAAHFRDDGARVPFFVDGRRVGSVARAHLPALGGWPAIVDVRGEAVHCAGDEASLTEAMAKVNAALRQAGLIVAWRDEPFPLFDPATLATLATVERAACRFWGTLTLGAHCNGFVADAAGRPTRLWIAQRSFNKATDPGKFDNLVGGGVAAGQTPLEALVREGWEEAGLAPDALKGLVAGSLLKLHRDIPEGLQHEWLYAYDLRLPAGVEPSNQDGEVAAFRCLPVDEAIALAAGDAMTVDAALVTIDFALRHRLLDADEASRVERRLQPLRCPDPVQPM
jgi:8-oxo-dGTP pyrophosphatase MutT (NUDIX family)